MTAQKPASIPLHTEPRICYKQTGIEELIRKAISRGVRVFNVPTNANFEVPHDPRTPPCAYYIRQGRLEERITDFDGHVEKIEEYQAGDIIYLHMFSRRCATQTYPASLVATQRTTLIPITGEMLNELFDTPTAQAVIKMASGRFRMLQERLQQIINHQVEQQALQEEVSTLSQNIRIHGEQIEHDKETVDDALRLALLDNAALTDECTSLRSQLDVALAYIEELRLLADLPPATKHRSGIIRNYIEDAPDTEPADRYAPRTDFAPPLTEQAPPCFEEDLTLPNFPLDEYASGVLHRATLMPPSGVPSQGGIINPQNVPLNSRLTGS